jgi:phospholipase/carboxylesterase
MVQPLTGPSRKPASGGPAKSLVVLLHGLGADGADLIELADPLGQVLPDAAFVAPNAPFACDMAPYGYQWFSLQNLSPESRAAGVDAAAPFLAAFIESELAARNLDHSRLALVGFSQGTMMSLHVGPRLGPGPAAIVGFSGLLVAPERLAVERASAPPILLIHGDADQIVPFSAMAHAAAGLSEAGLEVATIRRPGLGHGIDGPGLAAAAQFLVRRLGATQVDPTV